MLCVGFHPPPLHMHYFVLCQILVSLHHYVGGAGVNHVKRDWLEIFNVNCDLYIFFCVKRDWGYLRET